MLHIYLYFRYVSKKTYLFSSPRYNIQILSSAYLTLTNPYFTKPIAFFPQLHILHELVTLSMSKKMPTETIIVPVDI